MSIFPHTFSIRGFILDRAIVSEGTPHCLRSQLFDSQYFVGDVEIYSVFVYRILAPTFIRSGSACVNTGYSVRNLV